MVVKQINSRKVFITGQVAKPGPYPSDGPTTVVAAASRWPAACSSTPTTRTSASCGRKTGKQCSLRFNYDEVKKGKNLEQNIELKPGDTIIVP